MTEGIEGEGSEVARVWSTKQMGRNLCGSDGPAWAGSDVAGVPGQPHIRPLFGLDMEGAGQPGRLRALDKKIVNRQ